ncbi:MAG: hypothetical protein ACRC47_14825 [Shewanella sp.]
MTQQSKEIKMYTVNHPLKTELLVSVLSHIDPRTSKKYFVEFGLNMVEGSKDSYFTFPRQPSDKYYLLKILTEDQYNEAKRLILPLHLSDSRGAPMHTVDNGYYFVELARGTAKHNTPKEGDREKYIKILADHLRTGVRYATEIVDNQEYDKAAFSVICDTMRPKWEHDAAEAIEFIESIKHLSYEK